MVAFACKDHEGEYLPPEEIHELLVSTVRFLTYFKIPITKEFLALKEKVERCPTFENMHNCAHLAVVLAYEYDSVEFSFLKEAYDKGMEECALHEA